ncbi:MAG: serine/threonine protein kinase [Myxococcales bacterium]|nr:serine/threonine protein kinase [Myxococcales bacterium]
MITGLDHRVLHEYPWPIADAWKRVLNARPGADRLRQQRVCIGVIVRWLCAVTLAEYRLGPTDPKTDRFVDEKLREFSDGSWRLILNNLTALIKTRRRRFCDDLVFGMRDDAGNEGPLQVALIQAIAARNNEAHTKDSTPSGEFAHCQRFQEALTQVLSEAAFLASYRAFTADVSAGTNGRHTGRGQCLAGDGLSEDVDMSEPLLKDAVYWIRPDARSALLLHPYVAADRDGNGDVAVLVCDRVVGGTISLSSPSHPNRDKEFSLHAAKWVEIDERLGGLRYPRPLPEARVLEVPAAALGPAAQPPAGPAPTSIDNPLTTLFEILEPLGSGGMARVFRARDRRTGAECAVKVIHHDLVSSPVAIERFQREYRDLSAIASDHVVPVMAEGTLADGRRWIQMGLMCGSLQQSVQAGGQPLAVLLPWAEQMLRAVVALHAANIIHRDIKPSNFLVDNQGRVRLSDLGVAFRPGDPSLTLTGEGVGTARYMAPETRQSGLCTPRSDLWSLALTLHELHTGVWVPHPGEGVNGVFGAFLRCLGAPSPTARPSDAQATNMLAQALREDLKGAVPTASPAASPPSSSTERAPNVAAVSLAIPAAAATGALAAGVIALAVLGSAGAGHGGKALGRALGQAALAGALRGKRGRR